jgi:serine/threonine protein kinase
VLSQDWEAIYLVLELAPGGCLSERMKAVQGKFTEHEAAIILAQVLKALDALHQKGIVHRDVKFDNILVMSNVVESEGYNLVKLCDFGLCTSLDKNCSVASICGTKQFWAPEIVKAIPSTGVKQGQTDTHYDVKVDIWALGVVFFTLLYGSEPFKNEPDQVLYSKIQRGANFASHSAISPGAQHLASWLLSVDPHRRPSAQEALQHPWLLEHMNPEWKAKDASASTQDNGSATHIAPLCVPTQVHCIAV